jgi:hypothetical protein
LGFDPKLLDNSTFADFARRHQRGSRGSAISIAAKDFKALIFWAMQKGLSKPPVATAVKTVHLQSQAG